VARGEHALIGITVEDITNQSDGLGRSKQSGVVVTEVEPDSPAERGGVRTGDVIREINRKPIKDVRDFERLTNQLSPHASVLLSLNRSKATLFLSITTGR
jgi:serine protease Do